MEWIIGFLILAFLGRVFDRESSTTDRVERQISSRQPIVDKPSNANKTNSTGSVNRNTKHDNKSNPPITSIGCNNSFQDPFEAYKEYESALVKANSDKTFEETIHFLKSKGIHSFWHMTHRDNLKSLLESGILNHESARKGHQKIDISDAEVQQHRSLREPIFSRKIHDYAPLYITAKNPMLYKRKDISFDLCLIEVSLEILKRHKENSILFTDGNAASKSTRFSSNLKDMYTLPWDVLCSEYWNDFEDGKRKRCAEVLVYPSVPVSAILAIHVKTNFDLLGQTPLPRSSHGHLIKCSPKLFF